MIKVAVAVLAILLQALPPKQQTEPRSSIEGLVMRLGTDQPIGRAHILLTKVNGRLADSLTTTTDERGRFAVQNIPPGVYRLFADCEDYVRAEYGQRGTARPGASIAIRSGDSLENITLIMTPTGVVSGRVVDGNGEPASRIRVQALRPGFSEGKRSWSAVAEAQTNDLGEYRLFALPPGMYVISATRFGFQRLQGGAVVSVNRPQLDALISIADDRIPLERFLGDGSFMDPVALDGKTYSMVYYPGTTDPAAAQKLEVRPGSLLAGIDFRMMATAVPERALVHIRGQLIDGMNGQAAANASATLHLAERPYHLESMLQDSRDLSAGQFEFTNVNPGRYLISGYSAAGSGDLFVEVGSTDIESLRIVLSPRIALNGRITIEGATVTNSAQIHVLLESPTISSQAVARSDGTFTIPNMLKGEYRIRISGGLPNYYLKAARFGDTDVLNGGLRLDAQPSQPLELLVSPNAGTLDGRVLEDMERPAAGAVVVVIPDSPRRKSFDVYRTTVSDASGRFHVDSLIPGEYKVFAWEDIEENSWQDSEILQQYEERGRTIHILESAAEKLEIRMIPRP